MARVLHDYYDSFLKYTKMTPAPDLYKRWSAMSSITCALQRKTWCKRGYLTTYPNLYVLLVGEAALGKGVAMTPAREIIDKVEIPMAPEVMTRRGIIDAFIESEQIDEDLNGDAYSHSSLSLFAPEIAAFFTNSSDDLIYTLADIYDNGVASGGGFVDRTGQYGARAVKNVYFNLLGGITPESVQKLAAKDVISSGLSSRIIYVFSNEDPEDVPFPERTTEEESLANQLRHDLTEIFSLFGEFSHTKGYKEAYSEWFRENRKRDNYPIQDKRFHPYCKRRVTLHVPKMAMAFCASESNMKRITEIHLQRAIDLLEETEKMMPLVFGGIGELGIHGVIMFEVEKIIAKAGYAKYSNLFRPYQFEIKEHEFWSIIRTLVKLHHYDLLPVMDEKDKVKRRLGLKSNSDLFYYYSTNNYINRLDADDWIIKDKKYGRSAKTTEGS